MIDDPASLATAWQKAANAQDVERLLALSDPNIELAGPRGSGFGYQLLRDWMGRAGLTLTTLRTFADGDAVVFEQRGVWRSPETGEVTGERALASLFLAREGRIVKVSRFDDLATALAAGGIAAPPDVGPA